MLELRLDVVGVDVERKLEGALETGDDTRGVALAFLALALHGEAPSFDGHLHVLRAVTRDQELDTGLMLREVHVRARRVVVGFGPRDPRHPVDGGGGEAVDVGEEGERGAMNPNHVCQPLA